MSDFIRALKLGDAVGIEDSYRHKKIERVIRITPTGRIVTDTRKFAPDGWEIGTNPWNRAHLIEITDALKEEIEHVQLAEKLSNQNWYDKRITINQLRQICTILQE